MNWPTFIATHLLHRETFWLTWTFNRGLLHRPRQMGTIARSILVYTDATPTSFGAHVASHPPQQIHQRFTDSIPIARAEIAAALFALNWIRSRLRQPTNITLATDSAVTYYVLSTGKGMSLRYDIWLQTLYVVWFKINMNRGHGLVVRWVPSAANPADPDSRGVLSYQQADWL
jgi:ribonuclease HI